MMEHALKMNFSLLKWRRIVKRELFPLLILSKSTKNKICIFKYVELFLLKEHLNHSIYCKCFSLHFLFKLLYISERIFCQQCEEWTGGKKSEAGNMQKIISINNAKLWTRDGESF